ncbi:MAG: YicC family protein [Bacteroidota bacterium]
MSSASMTGFGRSTFEWAQIEYRIEIKSLNGKSLDLQIKATEPWAVLDNVAYKVLQQRLLRGKISLQVWAAPRATSDDPTLTHPEEKPPLIINTAVLNALIQQWRDWSATEKASGQDPWVDGALWGRLVAAHPMIFHRPSAEVTDVASVSAAISPDTDEEAARAYLSALEVAVQDCLEHRLAEGKAIAEALLQYLEEIRSSAEAIQRIDSVKEPLIRKKIEEFWTEWNNQPEREGVPALRPDPLRLEQELLYYLEKKDIAEELVRLKQHLSFALEILGSPGEQGRKLGFVAQEIGRELNTIGSKVSDFEIQRLVVLSKEVLEKIKEQSLNLL